MASEQDGLTELRELIETLEKLNAHSVVQGIRSALAAGIVRREAQARTSSGQRELMPGQMHGAAKKRAKGEATVQEAYLPVEAFVVASRLVVAAIDPIFMMESAHVVFHELIGKAATIRWEPDRIEGTEIEGLTARDTLEGVMAIPAPSSDEAAALRVQILEIRRLCDVLFKEVS